MKVNSIAQRSKIVFLASVIALWGAAAQAVVTTPCSVSSVADETCSISVDQLFPTQLTYGEIEVARRAEKIADMSARELAEYKREHTVPIVVGPGSRMYVLDHHHYSLALARAKGRRSTVIASVTANLANISTQDFWNEMAQHQWIYLFDENGQGPQPLASLGANLFQLKNDSFRSLAWRARKLGGYEDTEVPRADFLWANFFRAYFRRADVDSDFDTIAAQAEELAHSPQARHLPGYIP